MSEIEIYSDWSELDAFPRRLLDTSGLWHTAGVRALHRVGRGGVTLTGRAIREVYTTKAKIVRERLRVNKSSISNLEIYIEPTAKGHHALSLLHFKGRPKKPTVRRPESGVFAQVRKDGGGYLPAAFVAAMSGGHVGVYEREHDERLPVKKKYGPSVAGMMRDTGARRQVVPELERRLADRLKHESNWVLRKAGLL
ncbi:MAG: phage tail protein [Rhodospirillales bacterium]|nr:phage tail protein [Rhodospirillales bacterium]